MTNELGHPTRDLSPEEHWLNEHLPTVPEDTTLTLPAGVVKVLRGNLLGEYVSKEDHESAIEDARSDSYSEGYDDGESNGFNSRDDEVYDLKDELESLQKVLDENRDELEEALKELSNLRERCADLEDELSNPKESL